MINIREDIVIGHKIWERLKPSNHIRDKIRTLHKKMIILLKVNLWKKKECNKQG